MTAKDILRKTNRDNNYGGVISGGSILEKSIIEAMNTYALSVIEKAVSDEAEEWHPYLGKEALIACDRILTRAKTLIGE